MRFSGADTACVRGGRVGGAREQLGEWDSCHLDQALRQRLVLAHGFPDLGLCNVHGRADLLLQLQLGLLLGVAQLFGHSRVSRREARQGARQGTTPGHFEPQAWRVRHLGRQGKGLASPTIRRQNRAAACSYRAPRGLAFRPTLSAPLRNILRLEEARKNTWQKHRSPGERMRAFLGAEPTRAAAIFAVSVVCSADTAELKCQIKGERQSCYQINFIERFRTHIKCL